MARFYDHEYTEDDRDIPTLGECERGEIDEEDDGMCGNCGGSGGVDEYVCKQCNGTGEQI